MQDQDKEIVPVTDTSWARELYEQFAPVRQEARTMTGAEVDALVDEVVDEVQSHEPTVAADSTTPR